MRINRFKFLKLTVIFYFLFCLPVHVTNINADDMSFDSLMDDEIYMIKGDLVTVSVKGMTRLSVTNPDIADIVDADDREILLVAQEPGQTILFIWDEQGKRSVTVFVSEEDLQQIQKRVKQMLKDADLMQVKAKINNEEGKIVLLGEVSEDDQLRYETAIEDFDDYIIDLTQEEIIRDLIEINMKISEVATSSLKNIGIEWGEGGTTDLTISYEETLPFLDGSVGDLFQVGDFTRIQQFNFIINMLEERGEAQTLSRPKLIVMSGEEASFLVGGEVPIRTTTATDGASTENVEFKDYGVSLTMTPTIIKDKIEIELTIEDSDLDPANTTDDGVAFITRTTQTKIYVDDKEEVILAGFMRKSENEQIKQVPFLGNVPVLGVLFRNKANPAANQETELIVSMVPTVLQKNRNGLAGKNIMAREREKISAMIPKRINPNYTAGVPSKLNAYVRSVQQEISDNIYYPTEAQGYGWEGTVKLGMLILNDGTLAYALVKNSSGHEIFDEMALDKARASAPFAPFPADSDLKELNITIPIVYSLDQ